MLKFVYDTGSRLLIIFLVNCLREKEKDKLVGAVPIWKLKIFNILGTCTMIVAKVDSFIIIKGHSDVTERWSQQTLKFSFVKIPLMTLSTFE